MTAAADAPAGLDWLLTRFVERVPEVGHALLVSADGLVIALSSALPREQIDQLAAITSGLAGLAAGVAQFSDGGTVKQTVVDMRHGVLLVLSVADRGLLAVLAGPDADLKHVGYESAMLVQRVGDALAPAAREPGFDPLRHDLGSGPGTDDSGGGGTAAGDPA